MTYLSEDLTLVLKEADSIIIDSKPKIGKLTFAFFLIRLLFNEKALLFSAQESYLFNKKLTSLRKQFQQFEDIEEYLTRYYLNDDWKDLKRSYGYEFLLTELEAIISKSSEKLILFYRLAEFFEFQDRCEIENFYKKLIKIATKHNKKIIFIVDNQNQNYKYIENVAEEFSDISISLTKNENNKRLVRIRDIISHREYYPLELHCAESGFILQYCDDEVNNKNQREKNILIIELDKDLDALQKEMVKISQYIFDRKGFNLKYANSSQSILKQIFIKPDAIIILMKRSEENFETIQSIKQQIPQSPILAITDEEFVRTEDIQKAYNYGCDELFPKTYLFDKFILSFQKSLKDSFYLESLQKISQKDNVITEKEEFNSLAQFCLENKIFFSIFKIKKSQFYKDLQTNMRRLDYIYVSDDTIYYLAINTMPENINIILEKQSNKFELISTCAPLNKEMVEECCVC
jgi:hypothetical protein